MAQYDLIVAGAGFSGVAAAVAAAREGLRVLLVESSGSPGGAAVNNLVYPFMPYWTKLPGSDGKELLYLSRGIFGELGRRYGELVPQGDFNRFNAEYMKVVLDRILVEYSVDVLYDTTLCAAQVCGDRLNSCALVTKGSTVSYTADFFIDATGDAELAYMCGCPTRLGRRSDSLCQPMTLCFRVVNVDSKGFARERPELQRLYAEYRESGRLSNPRENILAFEGLGDGIVHFNSTRVIRCNPTDAFELSRAEMLAREQMIELYEFLKKNFACFADSVLLTSAVKIGIRESRLLDGEHVLTQEELKALTVFPDAVAAGNYDIDIHNPDGSGTSHYYFPNGDYYTVPYRSLIPKGTANLLVAGRCISATHEAQASIRIMPICCTLGEAAGVAAAVAVKDKTSAKQADIGKIQAILKANGAFIG